MSKDLLNKIIETKPEKRIKIEEIKKHQFYLLGKKLYDKKFNKIKINSSKELNYKDDKNEINIHTQDSIERDNSKKDKKQQQLFSEFIKTEIINRKNKDITLQNELINNNKLGLLSKCVEDSSTNKRNENKSENTKRINRKNKNNTQIFFTTRISRYKLGNKSNNYLNTNVNEKKISVEKFLKNFNKSQFHINNDLKKPNKNEINNHFKSTDKKLFKVNKKKKINSSKYKEKIW